MPQSWSQLDSAGALGEPGSRCTPEPPAGAQPACTVIRPGVLGVRPRELFDKQCGPF